MEIINGEIIPGVKIGKFSIGKDKCEVLPLLSDNCKVWERGDGYCIYTYDNLRLWFDTDGTLEQIGVTKGFSDKYQTIGIGSTVNDIVERFGGFENDRDEYYLPNIEGICFELEDVEDWDEMTAPVEWIFVYRIAGEIINHNSGM